MSCTDSEAATASPRPTAAGRTGTVAGRTGTADARAATSAGTATADGPGNATADAPADDEPGGEAGDPSPAGPGTPHPAGQDDPADPAVPRPADPAVPRQDGRTDRAGEDRRLHPGGPGYRRMSLALFAAGVATFALLYSTQALLPAISDDLRVAPDEASWTVAGATGGLAVAVLPLSALSERFGRRTLMTTSLTVATALALAAPFVPGIGWLIALRTLQGVALAGLPASAMAYLAEEVRADVLVGAIGLFVAGNSIGGMSGRVLTGWVSQAYGWRAALAAVALVAVASAVAFRALVPPARHFRPAPVGLRAVARPVLGHLANPLLRRLYAIGALFMTVFGAVYTVIGYRLADRPFDLPQGVVGSIFLVYLVGTFTSAGAGRLVTRFGRRGALYLGVGTASAGLLLTLLTSLVAVGAGLVLVTAGFFTGHSVASSAVSHTAQTGRAQASALYQSFYYVGSSAGGALGAAAFHASGWPATVALCLAAMVGAAGVTLYGTRQARAERDAVAGGD